MESHAVRAGWVISLVLFGQVAWAGSSTGQVGESVEQQLREMQERLTKQEQRLADQDAQIAAQAVELDALRGTRQANWLNERRANEVKSLIREVLADSETRASLMGNAISAGWEKGFFLAAEDGSFRLRLLGQVQVRHIYNSAENATNGAKDDPGTPDIDEGDLDDDRNGFEVTRIRLGFMGHVVDPSWQFFVWPGFHWDGGSLLLDAYIRKVFNDNFSVTVGQFKTPFLHEWLVSETRQQLIERSLLSSCFCGHYTQGIMANYKTDQFHAMLSINDGLVGINSRWDKEDVEALGVTGRLEWKPFGQWEDYADFQGWRDQDPLLVIGGALHYQRGEYGTTTDEADLFRYTADAQLEMQGWSLYVAFVGDHLSDSASLPDLNRYALIVQAGVFVTDDLELAARYEWGDNDVAGCDILHLVTVGFNKFFAGHQVKLSTDVGYSVNSLQRVSVGGQTFGFPTEFAGYQPESSDSEGQVVIRTQMQLLF